MALGVLRALVERTDQWAYKIPFALQWVWPIPIIIGVYFAPESPWWLVRQGRTEDAEQSLLRLTETTDKNFDAKKTIAMMVYTNELEKEIQEGTAYSDCFKGIDRRRTEIVCIVWATQNLCGAGLMAYSTYFYKQAGLSTEGAFDLSLSQYAIGMVGTVFSWVLMGYFGRRTLYLGGLTCLFTFLMIVGFIAIAPQNTATSWATGSMLLVYTFFYDSSVGPVCYSLVAEIPSTRLRIKSVVLARNLYNCISIINGVIIPYMLNPDAWNWKGKAGFFWGSLCLCCIIWTFFRLPEPKGRTYGELDILFEKKISARQFSKVSADIFETHVDEKDGLFGEDKKGLQV